MQTFATWFIHSTQMLQFRCRRFSLHTQKKQNLRHI